MSISILKGEEQAITAARLFADDLGQAALLREERQRVGAGIRVAAGQDIKRILPAEAISGIELAV